MDSKLRNQVNANIVNQNIFQVKHCAILCWTATCASWLKKYQIGLLTTKYEVRGNMTKFIALVMLR